MACTIAYTAIVVSRDLNVETTESWLLKVELLSNAEKSWTRKVEPLAQFWVHYQCVGELDCKEYCFLFTTATESIYRHLVIYMLNTFFISLSPICSFALSLVLIDVVRGHSSKPLVIDASMTLNNKKHCDYGIKCRWKRWHNYSMKSQWNDKVYCVYCVY